MKNILTAILVLISASAFAQSVTISSSDSGTGGAIWCYGGAGGGTTGPTNSVYCATSPVGGRQPVIQTLWGYTDMVYSNATWPVGCIIMQTPTNIPITVGAALSGTTNYVISNTSAFTNEYSNVMPSNTVLLAYNRSAGTLTRCEPYQAWATGAADTFTNIVLRHGVTLTSGDRIYVMHRRALWPTVNAIGIQPTVSNAWAYGVTPWGYLNGPIYGEVSQPLLIEARGLWGASNYVAAAIEYR